MAAGGGGLCVAGGMHGRGHAWWGACVAGGCLACTPPFPPDTTIYVNERAVRILLECILV